MRGGSAWVLLEVPPHGCGRSWPRVTEYVAEWRAMELVAEISHDQPSPSGDAYL